MKIQEFYFDEEHHIYFYGKRRLPSVTEIIKGVFGDKKWYDDWYAGRGKALHHACFLYDKGTLDNKSLDPNIIKKFEAYRKFRKEVPYNVYDMEHPMFSKKYQFAGTPDRVYSEKNNEQAYLADIKSSIEPIVKLQLGGYSILYEECEGWLFKTGFAVELKDNGNYKMKWIEDLKKCQRIFLNVLAVYNWKKQNY